LHFLQGFFPLDAAGGNIPLKVYGKAFYQMIMMPGQALGFLVLKNLTARNPHKHLNSEVFTGLILNLAISQVVAIFNKYGPVVPVSKHLQVNKMERFSQLLLIDMYYWQRAESEGGVHMSSNIPTIVALFAYFSGLFGHRASEDPEMKDQSHLFSIEYATFYHDLCLKHQNGGSAWRKDAMKFDPKFTIINRDCYNKEKLGQVTIEKVDGETAQEIKKRQEDLLKRKKNVIRCHSGTLAEWVDLLIVSGKVATIFGSADCQLVDNATRHFDPQENVVEFYNRIQTNCFILASSHGKSRVKDRDKRIKFLGVGELEDEKPDPQNEAVGNDSEDDHHPQNEEVGDEFEDHQSSGEREDTSDTKGKHKKSASRKKKKQKNGEETSDEELVCYERKQRGKRKLASEGKHTKQSKLAKKATSTRKKIVGQGATAGNVAAVSTSTEQLVASTSAFMEDEMMMYRHLYQEYVAKIGTKSKVGDTGNWEPTTDEQNAATEFAINGLYRAASEKVAVLGCLKESFHADLQDER
jgi:hypothetical protein